LGDSHANINWCVRVANDNPDKTILQLGDLGAGFVPTQFLIDTLPSNFHFFAGNHDSRTEAVKIPNYIGDYGEWNGIFYVSGAYSYDRNQRMCGINLWEDEELTHQQANDCLTQWEKSKVDILISHDAPVGVIEAYYLIYDHSHTRKLLQEMINVRKPKAVIYGHHHKKKRLYHDDVKYVALKIDEVYPLSELDNFTA
jgi:predicted phosphohydrolase